MKYVKSPLNYIGGKFKLLDQLLPLFPANIDTFYDLFCGGANVSINVEAKKIVAIDNFRPIMELHNYIKSHSFVEIDSQLMAIYQQYNLSKINQESYLNLRKDYNASPSPILFFALITNCFNHMPRFSKENKFNMPFGKDRSAYNKKMKANLEAYCKAIGNIEFLCDDYTACNPKKGNFVYCDPPYLITLATYNKDWTHDSDQRLFTFLNNLDKLNIHFALSNVLEHCGRTNDALIKWSQRYRVVELKSSYSNSSYHKKDRTTTSKEVVVLNY